MPQTERRRHTMGVEERDSRLDHIPPPVPPGVPAPAKAARRATTT